MVCGHVRRVCNSGIPDAFYLARPESGLLHACQTFVEDCGLSPRAWCHIQATLHGSAWSLSLERTTVLETAALCISGGFHLPEVPGLDLLHGFVTGTVLFPGEGL